ncbi:uncharacterized protein LOC116777856 [Danaus plexippus]|uniref:uncharacterized protein LOC116777856 n=1 Tax=Danaus plexippus TaxID=13037 RepID=UPI0013C49451|nr:uncharacterized protein LOC116777856 [Danaus plexippus]
MQCTKLSLQDRSKIKPSKSERSGRFCEKRMVDPGHEEDPRWSDKMFYCSDVDINEKNDKCRLQSGNELVLTVQNIQFKGNVEQKKRPRTGFKYKSLPANQKHRMFVRENVEDLDQNADCYSELSNYFDNYAKYFTNSNSSPTSSKSSLILNDFIDRHTENKAIQVDMGCKTKKKQKFHLKTNKLQKHKTYHENNVEIIENDDDTKILFHKNSKRKSITITRNESPATLQIIRVDVVCSYSSSSTMSDYEERKKISSNDVKENITTNTKSHLTNKYMLTNSVKTLDENISSGKVTLLCKTFKLSDRSKTLYNKNSKV